MTTLSTASLASPRRLARVWLARLAGNAAGFAVCYVVLVEVLWALGEHYLAPLVPRPPDEVLHARDYMGTQANLMTVPSVVFALALLGLAIWRRRLLWYVPGPLLGLLLGDLRDYADAWNMHCGGAQLRHDFGYGALVAQGLCLALAVRHPAQASTCKEMPMHSSIAHVTPRTLRRLAPRHRAVALALLLALASVSLAGCEIAFGHHVGDTISNAEARITLTSVVVVPSNAKFQPAAGDELVRLHVRLTNRGRAVWSFNEVQFAVQNGAAAGSCGKDPRVGCSVPLDGKYMHSNIQGYSQAYGYMLQPGATIESDILFEVGKGAHDARLVYQPDGMQDIANFWWLLGV